MNIDGALEDLPGVQEASTSYAGERKPLLPPQSWVQLCEDVTNSGRQHYMRALAHIDKNDNLMVTTRGSGVRVQGSGILSSMVWANCFVVMPAGTSLLPKGLLVKIKTFNWPEGDDLKCNVKQKNKKKNKNQITGVNSSAVAYSFYYCC